jgi:hypothetical protein
MLATVVYWFFQIVNGFTSLALVINPKKFHESTFKEPDRVYFAVGFSVTAREMLHNVLRGQGAALLSITMFLFYLGPNESKSMLLIAITCFLAAYTHIQTYRHHLASALVREALGDSLKSIYFLIGINLVVGSAALTVFLSKAG